MIRQVVVFDGEEQPKWDQLNKNDVDLGHVDNTADIEKPVSVAQQAAIDAAISPPILGAIEPIHKKRLKTILIIASFALLFACLVKTLNIHIVKTRNTFRLTSDRLWPGEIKHRNKIN